jgi:hypothetical protein
MRFTADYDSEEEEFPVGSTTFDALEADAKSNDSWSSADEGDDELDGFLDVSSPRASHDAWVLSTHHY